MERVRTSTYRKLTLLKKQKLEFVWIGKENRPTLEPSILLEESVA